MKSKKLVRLFSVVILGSPFFITANVVAQENLKVEDQATQPFSQLEKNSDLDLLAPIDIDENIESSLQENQDALPEETTSQTDDGNVPQTSDSENPSQVTTAETLEGQMTEESSVEDTSSIEEETTAETNKKDFSTNSSSTQQKANQDGWEYIEQDGYAVIQYYSGTNRDIVIPATLNNLPTKIQYFDAYLFDNFTDVTSIKFSGDVGLVDPNITSESFSIDIMPNLKTIDLRGLDFSNVTSMKNLFKKCGANLINVSGLDTSNVTNMNGVFFEMTHEGVEIIGLETWNTSNVINMDQLFQNTKLKKLDGLENWDVSKVEQGFGIFLSSKISNGYLNLSNWKLPNIKNINQIFEGIKSDSKSMILDLRNWEVSNKNVAAIDSFNAHCDRLLVITRNDIVTELANKYNNRAYNLKFNANGGRFSNSELELAYLETVAITPEKATIEEVKDFSKKNQPIKAGAIFNNWLDEQGNSLDNETDFLSLINNVETYTAQWTAMSDPNAPEGSFKPVPDSKEVLELSYIPISLTLPTTELQKNGTQSIQFENGYDFHVGVKDQNSGSGWQLNAQLIWQTPGLENSYIQSKNSNGQVNKNKNDGQSAVQDTDFEVTKEVHGNNNLQISTTEACVMEAGQGTREGVYDYALGQAELVIPEVQNVHPNKYTGNVNWNLIKAP